MITRLDICYMEDLINDELDNSLSKQGKRTFEELLAMRSMVHMFKTLSYAEWNTEENKEITGKYIRSVILNET